MAKGQKRSAREAKKPKGGVKKTSLAATTVQQIQARPEPPKGRGK